MTTQDKPAVGLLSARDCSCVYCAEIGAPELCRGYAPLAPTAPVEALGETAAFWGNVVTDREPVTHEVKCWPEPFAVVKSGAKPWELRVNDRDYRTGDKLTQREWSPASGDYTGDHVSHRIGWTLHGPAFGLPDGYVIMTLEPIQPDTGKVEASGVERDAWDIEQVIDEHVSASSHIDRYTDERQHDVNGTEKAAEAIFSRLSLRLQPSGETRETVTLAECPPGLFLWNGTLGFKSEYGAMEPADLGKTWAVGNRADAYCADSGEYFWGGTSNHDDRAKVMVTPIDAYSVVPKDGIDWKAEWEAVCSARIADAASRGSAAVSAIAAERRRQIEVEGWTLDHDDLHDKGEMAKAAGCYAIGSVTVGWSIPGIGRNPEFKAAWPWDHAWWKPKGRRPDLVRAGALIVAEIERLDRLALIRPAPVASGGQHSSANDFPPGEVTDEWAERFCEAVNWSPDGQECKAVEGQVRCVSFRDLAKGYILSAIATQPAITSATAPVAETAGEAVAWRWRIGDDTPWVISVRKPPDRASLQVQPLFASQDDGASQ